MSRFTGPLAIRESDVRSPGTGSVAVGPLPAARSSGQPSTPWRSRNARYDDAHEQQHIVILDHPVIAKRRTTFCALGLAAHPKASAATIRPMPIAISRLPMCRPVLASALRSDAIDALSKITAEAPQARRSLRSGGERPYICFAALKCAITPTCARAFKISPDRTSRLRSANWPNGTVPLIRLGSGNLDGDAGGGSSQQ